MASLNDFVKALESRDSEIEVKSYKRKKPKQAKKAEPETMPMGVDIPHVAPTTGDKIVKVERQTGQQRPPRADAKGVTIIGGGGG